MTKNKITYHEARFSGTAFFFWTTMGIKQTLSLLVNDGWSFEDIHLHGPPSMVTWGSNCGNPHSWWILVSQGYLNIGKSSDDRHCCDNGMHCLAFPKPQVVKFSSWEFLDYFVWVSGHPDLCFCCVSFLRQIGRPACGRGRKWGHIPQSIHITFRYLMNRTVLPG